MSVSRISRRNKGCSGPERSVNSAPDQMATRESGTTAKDSLCCVKDFSALLELGLRS